MSADIVNWLQVNIVNNPQVLKSLIALIILIVASFLMSEKPTEKSLFRSRRVWGSMLFVFAIFVFLLANIPDLGDVFIALATIVLACVAIFSFEESRRLRKQYKEQEERDRKERLLNEILEWAIDLGTYMLSRNLPPFAKHFIKDGNYFGEYLDDSTQDIVIAEYTKFRMRSVYVAEISKDALEIHGLVNNAVNHLRRQLRLLNRYNEQYNDICAKSGEEKAGLNIACNEDRLYNSAVEIVQTIGNIKLLD